MIEFITNNILLILILPLWVALILILNSFASIIESRKITVLLTVCSTFIGLLFSIALMWNFIRFNGSPMEANLQWFSTGDINFYLGILLDKVSALFLLILMSVSLIVQIYSYGYMSKDANFTRYYTYLNLFNFSMAGLILSSNLIQTYMFWELVGVCSYLLIGFWFEKYVASQAAKKAFIVNRIGDCGFLIGIICLVYFSVTYLNTTGSEFLAFTNMENFADQIYALTTDSIFYVICIFILLGAVAKSAQFPLHVWLADAMEAPTPVSALIHAATMVAAGIYLVVRMYPLFVMSSAVMHTILYIGLFTALITAYFALTQTDIKKMLAYSTSSQLGLMFVALGVLAPAAALFHLTTHAFTKALLFLTAGVVIKYLSQNQDMREMGGLRKKLPLAAFCYFVGAVSLSGLLFSGYFSKESILNLLYQKESLAVVGIFLFVSFMTAFYVFKSYFLVFEGAQRKETEHDTIPFSMNFSIIALVALTIFVGFVCNADFGRFFEIYKIKEIHIENSYLVIISIVVALVGLLLGLLIVLKEKNANFLPKLLYKASYNKFYIDELYDFFVEKIFLKLCKFLELFDKYVIDGLVNFVALLARGFAWTVSKLQNGNIQTYLSYSIFTAGLTLLVVIGFYFWLLRG